MKAKQILISIIAAIVMLAITAYRRIPPYAYMATATPTATRQVMVAKAPVSTPMPDLPDRPPVATKEGIDYGGQCDQFDNVWDGSEWIAMPLCQPTEEVIIIDVPYP